MAEAPIDATPAPTPKRRRPWYWRVARAMGLLAIVFLGLIVGCQELFIFPGSSRQGGGDTLVHAVAPGELIELETADGLKLVALAEPALDPIADANSMDDLPDSLSGFDPNADPYAGRPWGILFYGNAMSLADAGPMMLCFRRAGLNVIGVDYPGYGMSEGRPSEAGCYAAADAVYEHLIAKGVEPGMIFPIGWSLGSGVAIDLAHRRDVAGVVALSPFTSVPDAGSAMVLHLPIQPLIRHKFDSASKVPELTVPALYFHGSRDRVINAKMSQRLYELTPTYTERHLFDCGHNDLLFAAGPEITRLTGAFVERALAEQRQVDEPPAEPETEPVGVTSGGADQ